MAVFQQFSLQKAVYQRLSGDSALMALVQGVYDRVVQGSAFPYVSLSGWEAVDWSSMTTDGVACQFTLHVWSREGGHKQAVKIMERLYVLLHDSSPVLEAGALISIRYVSSNVGLEDDGSTYCGKMRFRALVQG